MRWSSHGRVPIALLVLLLVALSATANAEPPDLPPAPSGDERPWARGVSDAEQKRALEIYNEGNALFVKSNHAEALAKFREALTHWDHPAIRYNAAVVLVNLQQPLAAWENLELALKYGPVALGDDVYQQALTYQRLLAAQLSELELSCSEAGAEVLLDGKKLFVAPGTTTLRVMPGHHQLTATKRGFNTFSKVLAPLAGRKLTEQLKLIELGALTVQQRRWAPWKPWATVAGGAVVALAGTGVFLKSRADYAAVRASIDTDCMNKMGCTLGEVGGEGRASRARAENIAGNSLMIVGGAVAATGLVLVFLNQPRAVEVRPTASATGAGVSVRGTF